MNTHNANDCPWTGNDALMLEYHQFEWGIPQHDDRKLFEFLILESFQAGLSWKIILHKRENFRRAFDNFDAVKIAKYDENLVSELMQDKSIVRNQLKIRATIANAIAFLAIQAEFGSFDAYIWQFTDRKTIINHWKTIQELPCKTEISDAMSKDLLKRGFKFVGSTICYSFMQAVGMVDDHLDSCTYKSR
jgi:DNA-3-methyladenine glycosylase I